MSNQKEAAVFAGTKATASKETCSKELPYPSDTCTSSEKRSEQIVKRRAQIPRVYKATYDRAVEGKSLRAAINAQCLECVCWQRKEVQLCTSLSCPLYAVRPYRISQDGHNEGFGGVESKNSAGG